MKKYTVDPSRLCDSIRNDRKTLQQFRAGRLEIIRQLAGDRYSTTAAEKRVFVNLLQLYCNIVGRSQITKNPRVMYSTNERKNVAVVSAMQRYANDELERMQFANLMERLVLDAFISFGVSMVSLATPSDAATYAWQIEAGKPFISRVSPDDFVMDMNAKDFDQVRYVGNRFRAPLAVVKDDPDFNKAQRQALTPVENYRYNADGDERSNQVTLGDNRYSEEDYEDMVDLWQVYCPPHRCVYVFAEGQITGPDAGQRGSKVVPLGEKKWIGPDLGPYRMLKYHVVPDQPIPKGPLQDVFNLHDASNNVYRKLVRQAKDCKDIFLYMGNNSEDAARVQKTPDGGMAGVSNPQSVVPVTMGGINQGLMLFMRELIERFSWMSGNLVTMGGLAPQAGTLGQEELLSQQSNGQVAGYQDTTTAFVKSNIEALNWFWWNDPISSYETKYEVPGVPEVWRSQKIAPWNDGDPNALKRDGPMPKIRVDPHSMRSMTPSQRASDLMQIVQAVYLPMAQIAQQQGISLDLNELFSILGDLKDIPDLRRVLTVTEPPQDMALGSTEQGSAKPAETTRNYNRRSLGSNSAQAQDADMDATLAAGAAKPRNMNGKMSPSSM